MLKHLLAGLLLISHINFSMFIAQVDEVDIYDINGRRVNDINSVAEYVSDVILHHDKSRRDEDDNNARYFHFVKLATYCFSQQVLLGPNPGLGKDKNTFPLVHSAKPHRIFCDVITPPPKAIV